MSTLSERKAVKYFARLVEALERLAEVAYSTAPPCVRARELLAEIEADR